MNYDTAKKYFEKFLNKNFDINDAKISQYQKTTTFKI